MSYASRLPHAPHIAVEPNEGRDEPIREHGGAKMNIATYCTAHPNFALMEARS